MSGEKLGSFGAIVVLFVLAYSAIDCSALFAAAVDSAVARSSSWKGFETC